MSPPWFELSSQTPGNYSFQDLLNPYFDYGNGEIESSSDYVRNCSLFVKKIILLNSAYLTDQL